MLWEQVSRSIRSPQTTVETHVGMLTSCRVELATMEPEENVTLEEQRKYHDPIQTHQLLMSILEYFVTIRQLVNTVPFKSLDVPGASFICEQTTRADAACLLFEVSIGDTSAS